MSENVGTLTVIVGETCCNRRRGRDGEGDAAAASRPGDGDSPNTSLFTHSAEGYTKGDRLILTADDVSRLTLLTHKLPLSRWRKPMQDESKRVQDGHSRMDGAVARSRALTIQTKVSSHYSF